MYVIALNVEVFMKISPFRNLPEFLQNSKIEDD